MADSYAEIIARQHKEAQEQQARARAADDQAKAADARAAAARQDGQKPYDQQAKDLAGQRELAALADAARARQEKFQAETAAREALLAARTAREQELRESRADRAGEVRREVKDAPAEYVKDKSKDTHDAAYQKTLEDAKVQPPKPTPPDLNQIRKDLTTSTEVPWAHKEMATKVKEGVPSPEVAVALAAWGVKNAVEQVGPKVAAAHETAKQGVEYLKDRQRQETPETQSVRHAAELKAVEDKAQAQRDKFEKQYANDPAKRDELFAKVKDQAAGQTAKLQETHQVQREMLGKRVERDAVEQPGIPPPPKPPAEVDRKTIDTAERQQREREDLAKKQREADDAFKKGPNANNPQLDQKREEARQNESKALADSQRQEREVLRIERERELERQRREAEERRRQQETLAPRR